MKLRTIKKIFVVEKVQYEHDFHEMNKYKLILDTKMAKLFLKT